MEAESSVLYSYYRCCGLWATGRATTVAYYNIYVYALYYMKISIDLFCIYQRLYSSKYIDLHIYPYTVELFFKSTSHGTDFRWSIQGGGHFKELECIYKGTVWTIASDRYSGVIDLWRRSVKEVLLYSQIPIYIYIYIHYSFLFYIQCIYISYCLRM